MIPENAVAIRIVKIPYGDPAVHFRSQWVGLVLFPASCAGADCEERGMITGEVGTPREHYHVPSEVALAVLRQKSREAAKYFATIASAVEISFGADEVEVLG